MTLTDFDYIATRNQIIEGAMRVVGALEAGQNLTAEMLQQGVRALQLLVKSWANKHLFLWNFSQISLATVSAQEAYTSAQMVSTAAGLPIGVDKAWVVSGTQDLPLEVISYSSYLDIPNKENSPGRPLAVAFRRTPSPSFYVWPSPDAAYTVKLLCAMPLKDFDDAAGSGDISAEFQRALKYGLAEDLFDEYPGAMNEREYIAAKAAQLFKEAKNFDMPRETTNEVAPLFRTRC